MYTLVYTYMYTLACMYILGIEIEDGYIQYISGQAQVPGPATMCDLYRSNVCFI